MYNYATRREPVVQPVWMLVASKESLKWHKVVLSQNIEVTSWFEILNYSERFTQEWSDGSWFNPRASHFTCWRVLEQDTEPQIAPHEAQLMNKWRLNTYTSTNRPVNTLLHLLHCSIYINRPDGHGHWRWWRCDEQTLQLKQTTLSKSTGKTLACSQLLAGSDEILWLGLYGRQGRYWGSVWFYYFRLFLFDHRFDFLAWLFSCSFCIYSFVKPFSWPGLSRL